MVTVSKAEVLKIIFDSVGKPATEIYQKVRELRPYSPESGAAPQAELLEHSGETSFPNRSGGFDLGGRPGYYEAGWIEASALLPPVEREERDEEDTTTTKVSVPVLGYCIGGEMRIVRRIDEESDEPGDYEWHGWTREPDDGCAEAVTHWMPLPQVPEEA